MLSRAAPLSTADASNVLLTSDKFGDQLSGTIRSLAGVMERQTCRL